MKVTFECNCYTIKGAVEFITKYANALQRLPFIPDIESVNFAEETLSGVYWKGQLSFQEFEPLKTGK